MNSLDKFRSKVEDKQSELILRKLIKQQETGEIRNNDELKAELSSQLRQTSNVGFLSLTIPVSPLESVESERFTSYFADINSDIETLFVEVDHTESVLEGLADNVKTDLRDLNFSLGNLRSEIIRRRLRRPPGSGWSTIQRDSFDSGYGKLLGRSELTIDLFLDERSGFSQDHEDIPIKADARIEGLAKKLTLPETEITKIGFKQAKLIWEVGTTTGDIPVENKTTPYNMIDGLSDTFWSETIGSKYPILGNPQATVAQIAGHALSGNAIGVNLLGLLDPQTHDYYVRITGFSGISPQYVCLASPEDFKGPRCQYDLDSHCKWNYTNQYSHNCSNRSCARYDPAFLMVSSLSGVLEDGYKAATGAQIVFNNLSGIYAGQTWRVSIQPSGTPGARICIELTLTQPTLINWIEIEPVVTAPCQITEIEYTRQGSSTRNAITIDSIQSLDKVRLDFKAVEVDKIYLTVLQETYEKSDLRLTPKQQAINKIDNFITRVNEPSITEFYDVELEALLVDYISNGPMRETVQNIISTPTQINGCFYEIGFFEINCGLTSYVDTAISIAKDLRVIAPKMLGVQANLEPDIAYASGIEAGLNGTIEFSAIKFNYDKNNTLINIDQFPIPLLSSGLLKERLFIDQNRQGELRFVATLVDHIEIISNSITLTSNQFTTSNIYTPILRTLVTINDVSVNQDSIVIVHYLPSFGVYLNEAKTISIEDNRTQILSLSDVPAVIMMSTKSANRDITYADIYLKVILRRNDLDIYGSPGLRDYQFLISEGDQGRFF